MAGQWLEWVPLLWKGLIVTVQVTVLSALAALVMAWIAGLCRTSKNRLVRGVSFVYVSLFRGISLLVLLFWIYFALPLLGVELSKMTSAVLAIGLNYGAFGAEIVRSSVLAVPKGQWEASVALNMTPAQTMWRIILPQAIVRMLPPFNNLMIELLKATSLISFITLIELTFQATILRSLFMTQTAEIFGLLLVIYFILAQVITQLAKLLERKLTAGRM